MSEWLVVNIVDVGAYGHTPHTIFCFFALR